MEEILGEALQNQLNSCVSFKGTREGLHISFGEGAWQDLLKELAVQLDRPGAQSFFRGARVLFETGNRGIGVVELEELIALLAERQMTLSTVLNDPQAQNALEQMQASAAEAKEKTEEPLPTAEFSPATESPSSANALSGTEPSSGATVLLAESQPAGEAFPAVAGPTPGAVSAAAMPNPGVNPSSPTDSAAPPVAMPAAAPPVEVPAAAAVPTVPPLPPESLPSELAGNGRPLVSFDDVGADNGGPPVLLVHRSIRSGQTLKFKGTVIILGDVHQGGVVIAEGDVFVWGRLRGLVHAGAAGDDRATVSALRLAPTQLRIGNHIARAPDERTEHTAPAEIARVRGNQIVLEPWGGGRI